jgi:hypothetical protein
MLDRRILEVCGDVALQVLLERYIEAKYLSQGENTKQGEDLTQLRSYQLGQVREARGRGMAGRLPALIALSAARDGDWVPIYVALLCI